MQRHHIAAAAFSTTLIAAASSTSATSEDGRTFRPKVSAEPTGSAPRSHVHKAATMSEPVTRVELDAHLKAIRAEAETVRTGLDGKLDRVLDGLKDMRGDFASLQSRVHEDAKATTHSIWGLAIAMLAIILGLVGFLIANQGTMTAANGNLIAALKSDGSVAESTVSP